MLNGGIEQPAYGPLGGSVNEAKCGNETRRALLLPSPRAGRSLADWWLKLPAAPARLVTAIGVPGGSNANGVGFVIEVNGRNVFAKVVQPGAGWVPVEVSLAEWKGQPVALTFLTDSGSENASAGAAWAEPRLAPAR